MVGSIPLFEPQYVVAKYCHLWMELSFGDLYTCYSADDCAKNAVNMSNKETKFNVFKCNY